MAIFEILSQNLPRVNENLHENYQSGKAVQRSGLETGTSRSDVRWELGVVCDTCKVA